MKALVKGSVLWGLGWLPGGAALYRKATRDWLGTQGTHVDKLARVAPGYFEVWKQQGPRIEGAEVAILAPGLTPFWPMALRIAGCSKTHMVQFHEHMLPRYIARSAEGVAKSLGERFSPNLAAIEGLATEQNISRVLEKCDSIEHLHSTLAALPLQDASVDLTHSGGALEHFRPADLRALIRELHRVLKPGGLCSNVFDHRDHLYHADKSIEPMNHLRHSEGAYRFLYGHPLLYHNRLSPTEVATVFCEAGFEKIAIRRLTLPLGKYVADQEVSAGLLGCSRPARRFRSVSDLDIRTAACHYLFRKSN